MSEDHTSQHFSEGSDGDEFQLGPKNEILLFEAIEKFPPVGGVQKWHIVCAARFIKAKTGLKISPEQVENLISSYYNLDRLVQSQNFTRRKNSKMR